MLEMHISLQSNKLKTKSENLKYLMNIDKHSSKSKYD